MHVRIADLGVDVDIRDDAGAKSLIRPTIDSAFSRKSEQRLIESYHSCTSASPRERSRDRDRECDVRSSLDVIDEDVREGVAMESDLADE